MPTWRTINGTHVDIDKLSTEEQIRYFGSVEAFETYRTNTKMNEAIRTAAKPKKVSEKDIMIDGSFKTVIKGDTLRGVLALGDTITHVKTIAGFGTSVQVKSELRLNKIYGQNGNWKKQTGQANVKMKLNGKVADQRCDIHWYYHKNTGIKEMKIKTILRRNKK